ncbi:hypothetical protein ACVI1J_010106 [Bradyrhizobium diazoefficiens]|jgi:hypothetical protein
MAAEPTGRMRSVRITCKSSERIPIGAAIEKTEGVTKRHAGKTLGRLDQGGLRR